MEPESGAPRIDEPELGGTAPMLSPDAEAAPPPGAEAESPQEGPDATGAAGIGWRGIRATVGRALDAYGSAFPLYFALALPVAILSALTVMAGTNLVAVIPAVILLAITAVVTSAAMMFATDDLERGVRPGLADVLDRAAGRAIPVILASLAIGAAIGGLIAVFLIAAIVAGVVAVAASSVSFALVAILVLVPGAIVVLLLSVRWGLSIQAIVLGGLGPLGGLRRSMSLTRRHAWRLVGLYLALGLFTILSSVGASLLSTFAANRALAGVGLALSTLLTSPLLATALAIAYRDLASRPDGARAGVPRGRGRLTAIGALFGVGIIVLGAGIWAAARAGGQIYIAERGQVIAGTSRNVLDPCRPGDVRATFESSDPIWIAAIFTSRVPAGATVVVAYGLDGTILGNAPLTAGAEGLQCYYETDAILGASPGTYRITVTYGSEVLADGSFTVR